MKIMQTMQPHITISREVFLRKAFYGYVACDRLEEIVSSECISHCVEKDLIHIVAKQTIRRHAIQLATFSGITSIGGSLQSLLLYPLDFMQITYHMLQAAQELYYLYGKNDHRESLFLKNQQLQILLFGGIGAVSIATSVLSMFVRYCYQHFMKRAKLVSFLPFFGSMTHAVCNAYSFQCIANEYIHSLQQLNDQQSKEESKKAFIENVVDIEYNEVKQSTLFCNLKKWKELSIYKNEGLISDQEYRLLKQQL